MVCQPNIEDHVSNKEVLKRASLPSTESILLQVQLHWADHVIRMEDVCMPKEVFFATSASVKKESVIVVLQESVTMIS